MPVAIRYRHDPPPALMRLPALAISRDTDATFMAGLQGRSTEDIAARLADGHRAYVARYRGEPAAWGWVATSSARIGELEATVSLPRGDRYLWNFVTLAAYRGLGIYPRLLDAIVQAEGADSADSPDGDSPDADGAERFWIAYAPENHASGAGMRKAGFVEVAELSFDSAGRAALHVFPARDLLSAEGVFALPVASGPLAPCWRCVRAGRRGMSCRAGECRCDYQRPEAGCAA